MPPFGPENHPLPLRREKRDCPPHAIRLECHFEGTNEHNANAQDTIKRWVDNRIEGRGMIGGEMPNSNASPSAFGWDFQFNAGIVVMLDNICDAKSVKIEGMTEDIEVELQNGRYVFAQAKSCMNPDDSSNALRDLSKALETLSAADGTERANALLFVTNRSNPFNDIKSIRKFLNPYSIVSYENLPESCQTKIQKILSKKKLALRTDRFSVLALEFSGDGKARYETIKTRITEFLVRIDNGLYGFGEKMLDKWRLMFEENASQNDRKASITKKDMMWSLIVLFCEGVDDSRLGNFDDADSTEIREKFSTVISDHAERFGMVSRIMTEYEKYKRRHSNQRGDEVQKSFIEEKHELFASDFDLAGLEPRLAIAIRKITIEKILQQQRKISKVKEAVNL